MSSKAPLRSRVGDFFTQAWSEFPATVILVTLLVAAAVVGLFLLTTVTLWILGILGGVLVLFLLIVLVVESIREIFF